MVIFRRYCNICIYILDNLGKLHMYKRNFLYAWILQVIKSIICNPSTDMKTGLINLNLLHVLQFLPILLQDFHIRWSPAPVSLSEKVQKHKCVKKIETCISSTKHILYILIANIIHALLTLKYTWFHGMQLDQKPNSVLLKLWQPMFELKRLEMSPIARKKIPLILANKNMGFFYMANIATCADCSRGVCTCGIWPA